MCAGIGAAAVLGAGSANADAPDGSYTGKTDIPLAGLVWQGKTFDAEKKTVTNDFVFGLRGVNGDVKSNADGTYTIDYTKSGLGFLSDRVDERDGGKYGGIVSINGTNVGIFELTPKAAPAPAE